MQELAIIGIFVAAVVYLGQIFLKSLRPNSPCNSGCGKCSAIDFNEIEKNLKSKGITPRP